jgi:WD40 repeat protein
VTSHHKGEGKGGEPRRRAAFQIFPIAIGYYHSTDLSDLDVETQVGKLVDLLAPFGGVIRPWSAPARQRGADAIQKRLGDWRSADSLSHDQYREPDALGDTESPRALLSTLLYWVGHGWSDGRRHALAHAYSPAVVAAGGVSPQELAYALSARQALIDHDFEESDESSGWAFVVIDACRSAQVVDAMTRTLLEQDPPKRILLVGVSAEGATSLGRFTGALRNLLEDTFRTEQQIELRELATQLERVLWQSLVYYRGLGSSALTRSYPPVAGWMFAPMDNLRHLEEVLGDLSPDERWHFMSKARGSEQGELSWFFQGRQTEMHAIASWLDSAETGLLIVTGRAGSGKSALLGNVLAHSLPELRRALTRRGLVVLGDDDATPPPNVFDAVVHLSGLTLNQITARLAHACDLGTVPSVTDTSLGLADDIDWLLDGVKRLASSRGRLTILVDALDEAVSPLDTGRALLAHLASVPRVRVVVGTRASTYETPDGPADDQNLIDALVAGSEEDPQNQTVWLSPEFEAIAEYVAKRLRHARDYGDDTGTSSVSSTISNQQIAAAARQIAARGREFLFARLAVYELIEEPSLLLPGRSIAFQQLLAGDHQDLFAKAVDRLGRINDKYPYLIQALSLARGRGLPESDGIWARVTSELLPSRTTLDGTSRVDDDVAMSSHEWSDLVHEVLINASPYIGVDNLYASENHAVQESAGTVYRLAHRTFVEYFVRGRGPLDQDRARGLVAAGLLQHAKTIASRGGSLGRYLTRHLSGHVAAADRWSDLAKNPQVLDLLDPDAVSADAIRTLFGRGHVPAAIAGVVGARDSLVEAALPDRSGTRQLAMTIYGGTPRITEPHGTWGVMAARVGDESLHIRLSGHHAVVNKVCPVPLPDGRTAIASASDDGTIRLWDPLTVAPIGARLVGHRGTVEDVCCFQTTDGRLRLASAGSDGTLRIWDPLASAAVGLPMTGHEGTIWAVCVVGGRRAGLPAQGVMSYLASAGADGTVRLWDPEAGTEIGDPYRGHEGAAWALCSATLTAPATQAQSTWLVSGGVDERIHFWNPEDGQGFVTERFGAGPVRGLALVAGDVAENVAPAPWIAAAGSDGSIRVWDLGSRQPVRRFIRGHVGAVRSVAGLPTSASTSSSTGQPSGLLASAGSDGTVRVWDVAAGEAVGSPLSGHVGTVFGVCGLAFWTEEAVGGQPLVASAGGDGTVRVWDPTKLRVGAESSDVDVQLEDPIYAVILLSTGVDPDGSAPRIVTAGATGTISVWDPVTGRRERAFGRGHDGPVQSLCALPVGSPSSTSATIASGGADGTIRRWASDGSAVGVPLIGHTGPVHGLCSLVLDATNTSSPQVLLVSAGADGTIRAWDFDTGASVGPVITAHSGPVWSISHVPSRVSSSWVASSGADGTLRVWDIVRGQAVSPRCVGHFGTVHGVTMIPSMSDSSPDMQTAVWLVSSGADGTIRVWDPLTGREALEPLRGHTGPVFATCPLAVDEGPEGATLASVGGDGSVRLWNVETGQQIGSTLVGHVGEVHGIVSVPLSSGGIVGRRVLATAGDDGSVRLWSSDQQASTGDPMLPHSVLYLQPARDRGSEDEHYAIRANGALELWRPDQGELLHRKSFGSVSSVAAIQLASDRSDLLSVTDSEGRGALKQAADGSVRASRELADGPIVAAQQLPGTGVRIAYGLPSGEIAIWKPGDEGSDKVITRIPAHDGLITSLCLLKSGDLPVLLVSTGDDGHVRLWDCETLLPYGEPLQGHRGRVWSAVSIPGLEDSHALMASAGADATIRIWLPTPNGFATTESLVAHRGEVHALAVVVTRDNGSALLSGGHDGTVRLWDASTGNLLRTIPLGEPVHALSAADAARGSATKSDVARVAVGTSRGVLTLALHSRIFRAS